MQQLKKQASKLFKLIIYSSLGTVCKQPINMMLDTLISTGKAD